MSPARNYMKISPSQPIRQTRIRSKLQNAPPLMKGLDDRGDPIDALTQDPESITFDKVLEKVRESEDAKSIKSHDRSQPIDSLTKDPKNITSDEVLEKVREGDDAESVESHDLDLRRDRSVFDDPSLAGRAGIGGWADWSESTDEESLNKARGCLTPPRNKVSALGPGSSSAVIPTSAAPSPAKNRADSCSSSGSSDIPNGKCSRNQSSSASPVQQVKGNSHTSERSSSLSCPPTNVTSTYLSSSENPSSQVHKRKRSHEEKDSIPKTKKRGPSKAESSSPMLPTNCVKRNSSLVCASVPEMNRANRGKGSKSTSNRVPKKKQSDAKKPPSSGNDIFFYDTRRRSSTSRDLTPKDAGMTADDFTTKDISGPTFITNDDDRKPIQR
ncbi:hypothetical protein QQZ08_006075 [Neonectria magnoliae]|uniref:Uncharacterized protein n=1 Tax=Neonectria magnoliae TaxID=2732573 RepID=A0ABR1I2I7_9HYPO